MGQLLTVWQRTDKINLHKLAQARYTTRTAWNWKQWPEMRARSQTHTKLLHQNKNKHCNNGEIHMRIHFNSHITQACHSAGGWGPGHAGKFVCYKLYNQLESCSQEWSHFMCYQIICIFQWFVLLVLHIPHGFGVFHLWFICKCNVSYINILSCI